MMNDGKRDLGLSYKPWEEVSDKMIALSEECENLDDFVKNCMNEVDDKSEEEELETLINYAEKIEEGDRLLLVERGNYARFGEVQFAALMKGGERMGHYLQLNCKEHDEWEDNEELSDWPSLIPSDNFMVLTSRSCHDPEIYTGDQVREYLREEGVSDNEIPSYII